MFIDWHVHSKWYCLCDFSKFYGLFYVRLGFPPTPHHTLKHARHTSGPCEMKKSEQRKTCEDWRNQWRKKTKARPTRKSFKNNIRKTSIKKNVPAINKMDVDKGKQKKLRNLLKGLSEKLNISALVLILSFVFFISLQLISLHIKP